MPNAKLCKFQLKYNLERVYSKFYSKSAPRAFVMSDLSPDLISQLCFVLVDVSGSMNEPFGVQEEEDQYHRFQLTRLQAARGFLRSWVKIGNDFRNGCLYGLMSFDHRVRVRTELTSDISLFQDELNALQPNGPTRCFDAMKIASDRLIEASKTYTSAIKRLIVISDGLDNRTKQTVIENLPTDLVSNRIRVDAIIVTMDQEEIDRRLVAMARWTGGAVFCPRTLADGYRIMENEAFFDIGVRHFNDFQKLPITREMLENYPPVQLSELDTDVPIALTQAPVSADVLVPVSHFRRVVDSRPKSDRTRRLQDELRQLATKEDPMIRVFPYQGQIDVWKVLLKGPLESPYGKGWWCLSVDFPSQYPSARPVVRFSGDPPFHPNISNEGRVCANLLGPGYKEDLSMLVILRSIIDLLQNPNYDDPIDTFHADLLKFDRAAFDQKVLTSAVNNSRPTIEDWTRDWNIVKEPSAGLSQSAPSGYVPPMFVCPLTKKVMSDPVRASTGTYFERSALNAFLQEGGLVDPITRKRLDAKGDLNLPLDEKMKAAIAAQINKADGV